MQQEKKVIVTGGAGFIGHHLIEHLLKNTNWYIYILDRLSYASSGVDRLRDINCFDENRVFLFATDLDQEIPQGVWKEIKDANYVLHLAAQSHVDRSIKDPIPFIKSNILGTANILNLAYYLPNFEGFLYANTDEVFGPAPEGVYFKEWDRYNATNPYSGAKAGADQICLAYANTYKMPIFSTICMNAFGERQNKEKLIPLVINKLLNDEKVIIHSDPTKTIPGSRHWIHSRNIADAFLFLLDRFESRDKYNIVGEEINNLELAKIIADEVGKPLNYELVDFHSSRPGHDLRYALDGSKMREMGWESPIDLESSLRKTVRWTLNNPKWLEI